MENDVGWPGKLTLTEKALYFQVLVAIYYVSPWTLVNEQHNTIFPLPVLTNTVSVRLDISFLQIYTLRACICNFRWSSLVE